MRNQFEKLRKQEAKRLFEKALDHPGAEILFWARKKDKPLSIPTACELIKRSFNEFYVKIGQASIIKQIIRDLFTNTHPDSSEDDDGDRKTQTKPIFYFHLKLDAMNLFFRTHATDYSKTSLAFAVPEDIYKLQRRKSLRVNLEKNKIHCTAVFDGVRVRILDLSTGGCAIEVPGILKKMIRTNQKNLPLSLLLVQSTSEKGIEKSTKENTVETMAQIKRLLPIKKEMTSIFPSSQKDEDYKISLEFHKLGAANEQKISNFVSQIDRFQFSKLVE